MNRIFLSLAVASTAALVAAFVLGLEIEDPRARASAAQSSVGAHVLWGLAALVLAAMVHALVLTYFMGTGRWMEETTRAYRLPDGWLRENQSLKHRTIPAMIVCLLFLVGTGALGAAADPASAVGFRGWGGLSAGSIHFVAAALTIGLHLAVNLWEYVALERNRELIEAVMAAVRRIREERGLPVEA
ncbi:MAG TPA: hypothetical protein VML55_22305 [Planctomycetaceae bacterium]|nr:hypothetical protein [Planctomycetaceae bacterium]